MNFTSVICVTCPKRIARILALIALQLLLFGLKADLLFETGFPNMWQVCFPPNQPRCHRRIDLPGQQDFTSILCSYTDNIYILLPVAIFALTAD